MLKRVGIVANLRARSGLAGFAPILEDIDTRSLRDRVYLHLPDSVSKLSAALIELVETNKVQVLMVYGGDGTLHKVIDALNHELTRGRISSIPPIVTLGGGTQKSIFLWLGWGQGMFFQETPLRIFRRIMSTPLEHLPIRKMRPLAITFHNAVTRRKERHIGFIFCMGAVARVIKLYEAEGKAPISGLKHIALGMTASFFGQPRSHSAVVNQFEAEQWADGVRLNRTDPLSVLCSVTESLLFGIEPFTGFAESNQFYAISYCIPSSVISALVPVAWRATVVPPGERFFNRPVFSFSLRPIQENLVFVDGDFYTVTPGEMVQIELGPELSLVSSF